MRPVPVQKSYLIDQLQAIVRGLRDGSLSATELPRSLLLLMRQLSTVSGDGPNTNEWIVAGSEEGDALAEAEGLVTARPHIDALDLDPEPPIELEHEGPNTSAHDAIDLLGLSGGTRESAMAARSAASPSGSAMRRVGVSGGDAAAGMSESAGVDLEELGVALHALPASRYEAREVLGTGGQGDVREVYDRFLQRVVAIKALRDELAKHSHSRTLFLREACLTAQLSHPGIVPIYDVGELASGAPCYTMKRIRGRSLKEILSARRRGEGWASEYSRRRLIEILVQVAHAVGYAHDRGVVHRDLKPANIMVGDYGEVLVVDWGIARVLDEVHAESPEGPVSVTASLSETGTGTVKGTPAYMSPEQARGERELTGAWTDVHALGLILFEILTGEPARAIGAADQVVAEARRPISDTPEGRRVAENLAVDPIPEELDQICATCLAPQPESRYPNGEDVAKALRAYLEGQRRREIAESRAREGEVRIASVKPHDERVADLRRQLEQLRQSTEPWAGLERKRPVWELEAQIGEAEKTRDDAMNQAIACFTQALDDDPGNARSRRELARIYYDRLLEAERFGRVRDARQLEEQVRRFDDGSLATRLEGQGALLIDTQPDRGEVWLYRYELVDRQLRPMEGRKLGRSPVEVDPLPMGRYLVVVRMRGGREVYYPVVIRRSARWEGMINLRPELDDRFILVPAGPCRLGGDRQAIGSLPHQDRWVDDYAIARLPITCREYLRFLHTLPIDEAMARVPRTSRLHGSVSWWPVEGGQIQIPRVDEGGGRWDPRYPVRAISRVDAEAYCEWRSRVEELPLRLPTDDEWEKAARGVDGRLYPWGDSFDATFCKMRESRPGKPEPEPVGAFQADRSPYGVQDMAGSISEWVADPFDRYQLLGTMRGGYWRGQENACRLARRFSSDPEEPAPFGGFRMALDLSRKG